ncbi:MAG: hypothetical protein K2M07_01125 [Muribaculaceae bacterium]|nr:hypothetical protein [Muribaculaceae bacterium]
MKIILPLLLIIILTSCGASRKQTIEAGHVISTDTLRTFHSEESANALTFSQSETMIAADSAVCVNDSIPLTRLYGVRMKHKVNHVTVESASATSDSVDHISRLTSESFVTSQSERPASSPPIIAYILIILIIIILIRLRKH